MRLFYLFISFLLFCSYYYAVEIPSKNKQQIVTTPSVSLAKQTIPSDIRVYLKGLVCSFCAQGLKKSLKKHKSVKKAEFDKKFKYVDLYLKRKKNLSDKKISSIVKNSGYLVESIDRK